MQSKTKVPRSQSSLNREESTNSLNVYSEIENHIKSHGRNYSFEDIYENQPLLSKPVNPNSALAYRPIKLPLSSLMSQSKSGKKTKKQFYSPHDLATDLYSTESPSEGTPQGYECQESDCSLLPELSLTKASMYVEEK